MENQEKIKNDPKVIELVVAHNKAVEASKVGGDLHVKAIKILASVLANTPESTAKEIYPEFIE